MYKKLSSILSGVIIIFVSGLTIQSVAQQINIENRYNIGIQLNQYQQDFGMGINLTSPYFANQQIAIRLRGNVMFHEHIDDQESTWSPYLNSTLGIATNTGTIGNSIRLYGEGGIIGLFPSDNFSSETFEFGGFGLFGFEFFMKPDRNYFIEIGATGTGARADRIVNRPFYSNGMIISTGFRFNL